MLGVLPKVGVGCLRVEVYEAFSWCEERRVRGKEPAERVRACIQEAAGGLAKRRMTSMAESATYVTHWVQRP